MNNSIIITLKKAFRIYSELRKDYREKDREDATLLIPVASRIWKADKIQSPFGFPATFQASVSLGMEDFATVFERMSIFEPGAAETDRHHNIAMNCSTSFREAVFHVSQYEKRMEEYGLTPVMGSENNLLPNIHLSLDFLKDHGMTLLNWSDEMACMGVYDMHKYFGDYKDAPPTTMRFIDLAR